MFSIIVINKLSASWRVKTISGFYAQKLFKKTTLYVVRTDLNGNYKNSAPCQNCYSVINELKIKRIIFSTDDEKFAIFKTSDYYTEHISNGNRYLNMSDEKKKKKKKKKNKKKKKKKKKKEKTIKNKTKQKKQ